MAAHERTITILDPKGRLGGEDVVYDVLEHREDGALVITPHHLDDIRRPAATLDEFVGVLGSGGELRRTVEALRDEWPS